MIKFIIEYIRFENRFEQIAYCQFKDFNFFSVTEYLLNKFRINLF